MTQSYSSGDDKSPSQDHAFKSLNASEYITKRLDQYISWYDRKSVTTKSRYLTMRAGSVVGAAVVPVLANIPLWDFIPPNMVTTVVSLGVVILVSLESVYHFGDQWRNYRSTEQFLSREKFLYQAGEGSYHALLPHDAFALLVNRCENQIAAENSATLNVLAVAAQQPDKRTVKDG